MQNELALGISKQFNLPAAATSETFLVCLTIKTILRNEVISKSNMDRKAAEFG